MRAAIPDTRIDRARTREVEIGELKLGPAAVDKLVLTNLHVGVSTGSVQLRGVRITVGIAIAVEWSVSVTIPLVGQFGWSGTIDLGNLAIPLPPLNANLTGLETLDIDLNSVTANNLSAVVDPLVNLNLGAVVAEGIRARDLVVPAQGFQIAGLGMARLRGEGIAVPAATIDRATVDRVAGGAAPLGDLTLPNLGLPRAALGSFASDGLLVNATSNPYVLEADASVVKIDLRVKPSVRLAIDELRVNGVTADASIDLVELKNVVLPYEVLDLKLREIGIEKIEVPELEVS